MQKKVYTKDLSLKEILDRLNKGEKLYYKFNHNLFYQRIDGLMITYLDGKASQFAGQLSFGEDYYFLDEVEEPEADESCIGKLCKFWYEGDEPNDYIVSILNEICEADDVSGIKYRVLGISVYDHCKPLTKEEALALVKE